MTVFVFYQSFPLFFSEIILFITIINVQGIFSPSCRLKTLAMNRVEQIMTINIYFFEQTRIKPHYSRQYGLL